MKTPRYFENVILRVKRPYLKLSTTLFLTRIKPVAEKGKPVRRSYYPETDSLYIDLSDKLGAGVAKVADHVVVDVDETGVPVGTDIDANASEIVDLSRSDLGGVSPGSIAFTSEPRGRKTAS